MKTALAVLLYLTFPLLLFWWGWFSPWVALISTVAFVGLLFPFYPVIASFWKEKPTKTSLLALFYCGIAAFVWTYLAGVGGFRPQHFDYYKHNLVLNNLVRYSWPVQYSDGSYLCYYLAYYLPAAALAKLTGGMAAIPYYLFGWTWLGLWLVVWLLYQLGGKRLLLFFALFSSPNGLLLVYEIIQSPLPLGAALRDIWTNDHTIELIQSPGGLMFISHIDSFSASPQHALPAWLTTALFLRFWGLGFGVSGCGFRGLGLRVWGCFGTETKKQETRNMKPETGNRKAGCGFGTETKKQATQNRKPETENPKQETENSQLTLLLIATTLYWSPLVAAGFFPFLGYQVFQEYNGRRAAGSNLWDSSHLWEFLLVLIISIPAFLFFSGHVPLHDARGWWWNLLSTPHQFTLWGVFILLVVGVWTMLIIYLKKKGAFSPAEFQLLCLSLIVLFALTLFKYGHYNDLPRRAGLPATLVLCWGLAHSLRASFFQDKYLRVSLWLVAIFSAFLPFKHHALWLTARPYVAITDKTIRDFTPYSIHYLSHYHWGEFDVVSQYLGAKNSAYLRHFAPAKPTPLRQLTKAFYYWKSEFSLSDYEKRALTQNDINKLYIRFFDVDWDPISKQAVPKAVVYFKENPPVAFVPTVFITNRTLEKLSWGGIDELAKNIAVKINTITQSTPQLHTTAEVQIDCDWSLSTRRSYFQLLTQLKKHLPTQTTLSATIRLHQIKFYRTTGVPPVARGMLMYYNMGDWRSPRTENSILDLTTAGRYADYISDYPLPLDVVLPLFRWAIFYRNGRPLKIINHLSYRYFQNSPLFKKAPEANQYIALANTHLWGISVRRGDRFRVEESTVNHLSISARTLAQEIQNTKLTFALYHLDSTNLSHYERDSLQQIIQAFR